MPRPGPAPDPRSVNRMPKAEWHEVLDVPFDYRANGRSLAPRPLKELEWSPQVLTWYAAVASLPHAAGWRDDDWIRLYDLAILKQKFYTGVASSSEITEMRKREDDLGVSAEARLKNRIRYIAPPPVQTPETPAPEGADLPAPTPITSARDRLRRRA